MYVSSETDGEAAREEARAAASERVRTRTRVWAGRRGGRRTDEDGDGDLEEGPGEGDDVRHEEGAHAQVRRPDPHNNHNKS